MANTKTTHTGGAAHARSKQTEARRRQLPLLVVAVLGMLLTAYLSYRHGQQGGLAFCAAGSGCDVVQSSRYSTLLHAPLAAWGFLAYAALALAAWQRSRPALWFIACTGVAISVYLTVVGLVELGASCPWCLASLGLWVLATGLAWRGIRGLPGNSRVMSPALALVAALVLHLHYAGVFDPAAGPADPYARSVADALTASGAKFYGASWCPHCQQQKKLFGTAARYLPYVECAPNGAQAPQSTECVAEEIKSYPTWVINGNRYRRMLSVRQLGLMAGVAAAPDAP